MGKYDDWTRGQDEALLNRLGGTEVARGILSGELTVTVVRVTPPANLYPITVSYDQSLADMIVAGRYDWINQDITVNNFPISGKGKVEISIELIHLNKYMSSESVLVELDKRGLRPATLPELLAFGAVYQEIQRQFPIVALGSVWRRLGGERLVPSLWRSVGERFLGLRWFESGWPGNDRFAAVSK